MNFIVRTTEDAEELRGKSEEHAQRKACNEIIMIGLMDWRDVLD